MFVRMRLRIYMRTFNIEQQRIVCIDDNSKWSFQCIEITLFFVLTFCVLFEADGFFFRDSLFCQFYFTCREKKPEKEENENRRVSLLVYGKNDQKIQKKTTQSYWFDRAALPFVRGREREREKNTFVIMIMHFTR